MLITPIRSLYGRLELDPQPSPRARGARSLGPSLQLGMSFVCIKRRTYRPAGTACDEAGGSVCKSTSGSLAAVALAVVAAVTPGVVLADTAATELIDPSGAVIGRATFEQTTTGVLMYVDVAGLPPGPHGISPARRRLLYAGFQRGHRPHQP